MSRRSISSTKTLISSKKDISLDRRGESELPKNLDTRFVTSRKASTHAEPFSMIYFTVTPFPWAIKTRWCDTVSFSCYLLLVNVLLTLTQKFSCSR
jgi:hypothetical protein